MRDEALVLFRKLKAANVPGYGRTILGTTHAGDIMFRKAMPDVYAATVRDIVAFAESLQ